MGGSNHAIVFGASGLIGWALVNQLLSPYPSAGTFSKVTAITNRPITLSESYWPESAPDRPDLQLVSGIDLRHGDGASLAESLKHAVRDVEGVTHIYYLGGSFSSLVYEGSTSLQSQFSPRLRTVSRNSPPICRCSRMSLMPTA